MVGGDGFDDRGGDPESGDARAQAQAQQQQSESGRQTPTQPTTTTTGPELLWPGMVKSSEAVWTNGPDLPLLLLRLLSPLSSCCRSPLVEPVV